MIVIIDRSTNGGMELINLQSHLLAAQNTAEQLMRQVAAGADEQIVQLHGIPLESVAAYKVVLADIETVLKSTPVETLLSNVA